MLALLILTITTISLFIFIFFIKYHIVLTVTILLIPICVSIFSFTIYGNVYLVLNSYWSYCIVLALVQLIKPTSSLSIIILSKLLYLNFYKKLIFMLII